jgi:hypothetical protein
MPLPSPPRASPWTRRAVRPARRRRHRAARPLLGLQRGALGEADGPRAGLAALAALDESLPRHAAVTAYLHQRDGDLATAARLYAEAARPKGSQPCRARPPDATGRPAQRPPVSLRDRARDLPSGEADPRRLLHEQPENPARYGDGGQPWPPAAMGPTFAELISSPLGLILLGAGGPSALGPVSSDLCVPRDERCD